ncbi:hypothetical protein ACROYT_G028691 [Oculina patagonica]
MNSKASCMNMLNLKPYLLFLCLPTLNGISDNCRTIQFRPQTKDKALENHVITSMQVRNQNVCELRCYQEPNCVSYNYGPTASSETASCDLNNRTHLQVSSSDFVSKDDYIYRYVLNSCQSSPCPSNATCQTGFTAEGYRCICPQGYKGDHCEEDIDECEDNSHNCKPYADCCNLIGSFQCICKPDYIGDGITCTGQPPRVVNCFSLTISEATNSYEINADHSSWSEDGFCRVIPEKQINAGDSYTMEVELMNVITSYGVHHGFPGVMYNVIDENNFNFVYFRLHDEADCYRTGHVLDGQCVWGLRDTCPNGNPSGGVWFTVRVEVSSDKSVDIYLNNDLVTSLTAYFNTKGRGGVLVANGFSNIMQFKKFSVTSN